MPYLSGTEMKLLSFLGLPIMKVPSAQHENYSLPVRIASDCANVSGRGALGVRHGSPADNSIPHFRLELQPAADRCSNYSAVSLLCRGRRHHVAPFGPDRLFSGPRRRIS